MLRRTIGMKTRGLLTAVLSVFTAFALAVTGTAALAADIPPEAAVTDGIDKSVTLYESRTDSVELDSSYTLSDGTEILYEGDTLHIIAQVTTDSAEENVVVSIDGDAVGFDDDSTLVNKTIPVDTNGCIHVALYAEDKGTAKVSFILSSNPLVKNEISLKIVEPDDVKSITLVPGKMVSDYWLGELTVIDDMDFGGTIEEGGAYLVAECYNGTTYNVEIESGVHPTAPDVRTVRITSDFKGGTVNVNTIGTQVIYFVYEGCYAPFTIDIKMDYITDLKIKSLPYKLEYNIGERPLDLDGGTLIATHRNGRTEEIDMSDNGVSASGFDTSTAGAKTITLTYEGKKVSFVIAVLSNSVQSIEVVNAPSYCYKGSTLNFSNAGTYIHVTYANGSTRNIYLYSLFAREGTSGIGTIYEPSALSDAKGVEISGYDKDVPGKYTVLVTYGGCSDRFVAEVRDIEVDNIVIIKDDPGKTDYYEGDELDLDGFSLLVTYTNGDTEEIDLKPLPDGLTVSEYRKDLIGTQLVFFNYKGKSTQIFVTVHKIVVDELTLTTEPAKTDYLIGEPLDLTGGVLTAKLESGDTKVIPTDSADVTASGFTSTSLGDQTITLTYKNKSVTYTVNVDRLKVTELKLSPAPTRRAYKIGEALDLTGGKLYIYYNNSTYAVLDCSDPLVANSGFDSASAGTKTVALSFGGQSVTYDVTVAEADVVSIAVTTLPTKTAYQIGDALDVTGGVITVTYSDGRTATVAMTADMVSGFSSASAGTKTLTVTYGGRYTTFPITVAAGIRTVTAISMKNYPKTSYLVGETLDVTDGVLNVTYSDGTSGTVAMSAGMVSGFSSVTAGAKTLTVNYSGCVTTYSITVTANARTPLSIAVTTLPKKEYKIGEALDVTGGVVTVTYSDGTSAPVAMTSGMVSGFSSSSAGTKTLTVTYLALTTTYSITVSETITGKLEITSLPAKLKYYVGQSLDLTGGMLKATFSNGTTETAAFTDAGVTVTGFDTAGTGGKRLTVHYKGLTAVYDISIFEKKAVSIFISSFPTKLTYSVGESLDLTGGTITAAYIYGDEETVRMTDSRVSVSGFDSVTPGSKHVRLSFDDKSASFAVTVVDDTVKSISVYKDPNKISYFIGEALDLTGGVIKVTYNGSADKYVDMTDNDVSVSGFSSSTAGTKVIRVTYGQKVTTFTVSVVTDRITSLVVEKMPTKRVYKVGDTLDLSGGKLRAIYNNGARYDTIDMDDIRVTASNFNSSTPGTKNIQLGYAGAAVTISVTVVPPDNVMIDSNGYDTLYDALSAINSAKKNGTAKSSYTIEINNSTTETKSLTFPAVPIEIVSAEGASVTITKLAVSAKASLALDSVTFVTNKGKMVNFTVKGSFVASGCNTGNINATGSVTLDTVTVSGKIVSGSVCSLADTSVRDNVYSKGAASLARTTVGKTLSITATSGSSSIGHSTVSGKTTCANDLTVTDSENMGDIAAKKDLTISDSSCKSLNVKKLLTVDGDVAVSGAVTTAGVQAADNSSVLSYTALSVTTNGITGANMLTLRVTDKNGYAVSLSPSSSKTNVVAKKFKGNFRNTLLALSTDNYHGTATLTVKSSKLIIS